MSQAEAGAHLTAGGEGESPEEPELGPGLHRRYATGTGRSAETEGHESRHKWLPDFGKLISCQQGRRRRHRQRGLQLLRRRDIARICQEAIYF